MLVRAISKKTYRIIYWTLNVSLSIIFVFESTSIVILAILFFLTNMQIVSNSTTLVVNVVCAAIGFVLFIVGFTLLMTAGSLVIKTIRRTSMTVKQASSSHTRNPIFVTIGLISGLLVCILFQLIAAAIASAISADLSGIKVIWHLVNSLGVLIFSIIIMLLFSPMFIQTESVVSQFDTKMIRAVSPVSTTESMATSETCTVTPTSEQPKTQI